MELYAIDNDTSIETLKEFCSQGKMKFAKNYSTMFSYMVFFDNKANAKFPANPLTAGYNDGSSSRHIKAIYTFNRINNYSKLSFYKKNSYESLAEDVNI